MRTNDISYDNLVMQYKELLMRYYYSTEREFLNIFLLQCILAHFSKNILFCSPKVKFSEESIQEYFDNEKQYTNEHFLELSRQMRIDYGEHSFTFLFFAIQKRLETLGIEAKFQGIMEQLKKTIFYIHQVEKSCSRKTYIYQKQSFSA